MTHSLGRHSELQGQGLRTGPRLHARHLVRNRSMDHRTHRTGNHRVALKPTTKLHQLLTMQRDPMACAHKKWRIHTDHYGESCTRCNFTIRTKFKIEEIT